MTEEEYPELGLSSHLRIFARRKSTVLLTLAAFLGAACIYILMAERLYEARSQLLLERSGPKVLSVEEIYSIDSTQKDYYLTQCEIIVSANILNRVLDELGLRRTPPFSRAKDPVAKLRKMIKAQPLRDSRLINVSVIGADPEEITRINHALIDTYIKQQLEDKIGVEENAADWLSGQIKPLRRKLEDSEEKVRAFLQKERISSIEEAKAVVNQKISSVNESLIEARKKRLEIEARYLRLKEGSTKSDEAFTLPAIAQDELIKNLKMEKIKLDREYSRLSEIYRPGHPEMLRTRDQISFLEKEMDNEVLNIIEITRQEYEAVKEYEETLEGLLGKLNREASRLNKLAVTFNILQRDVKSNRKLYEAVVDRLKETDVIDELTRSGVQIVDRAEVPKIPIRPRKTMVLLLSAVVGLVAGMALALYRESVDTSFRYQEEAESYLMLPVLGQTPYLRDKRKDVITLDLMTHNEPRSTVAESFNHIRNYLESIAGPKGLSTFLVTGSSPQEGKTDVAVNLAISFSEVGRKVLLLDADLRRPRLHNTFALKPIPGFNELLSGEVTVDDVVHKTSIANLSVIPCGKLPGRPAELLETSDQAGILQLLKNRFEYIILDSPPILPVTDALILADVVDGIIQVVQGDKTGREIARAAKNRLSRCKAQMVGIVLTQLKSSSGRYYNYYGY